MSKRGLKINIKINLTNRWLYTLIAIGILAIVAVGVYALAPSIDTSKGYHEPSQISVNIGGTEKTLQQAIDAGDFGSGGTETDPTVVASVKDGVSWSELSGIPTGFADGVDNVGSVTKANGVWQCMTGSSCQCGPSPICSGQIIYSSSQPSCGCGFYSYGSCVYETSNPCSILGYLIE